MPLAEKYRDGTATEQEKTEQLKSADPVTYDSDGDIILPSERFRTDRTGDEAWKNGDIRYQKRGVNFEPIDLTNDNELTKRIGNLKGAAKYKAIQGYILEELAGEPIILSDNTKATVDRSDAAHIAHGAREKKTAEIAKIKELIEKAVYCAYDYNADHDKFDSFKYYYARVRFGQETFDAFLNIGRAINDHKYHLYEITPNLRKTANLLKGFERAMGLRSGSDFSIETISQPTLSVKPVSQEISSASLTNDRISDLIKEYGASGNYAKAYVTSIDPRDFLRLTVSDDVLDKWNAAEGKHEEIFALDEDKLRSNRQTPYLNINHETGEVEGHEGRHRMRALWKAGITSVPIAIVDTANKYGKTVTDKMTVSSQDFGEGSVNGGYSVTLKNLIPTNEQYREQITRDYGGEAKVRYQRRDYSIDFSAP